jgi:non-heme chloroperoxidase
MAAETRTFGTVPTPDGAQLYYEAQGEGSPVLLLPPWMGTIRLWDRQTRALSDRFRVIATDLRAHGNSSKAAHGHTVCRYAQDVRAVIEELELSEVALIGWSLSGSVVLEYWRQYGPDRVRALGLVDISPFPFSPEAWNGHGMRNYNYDGMNALVLSFQENRREATARLARTIGFRDEDVAWATGEALKTPTAAAIAIYSDFLIRDLTPVLETITVPTIVWAAESDSRKAGIAMGRHIAAGIPGAAFVPFDRGGHVLAFNEPDLFNDSLVRFLEDAA